MITPTLKINFYTTVRQELVLRNYGLKTVKAYINCLRLFVRYFFPPHPLEIQKQLPSNRSKMHLQPICWKAEYIYVIYKNCLGMLAVK